MICQGPRKSHYTLVDEARNTDSNKTWRSDSKLRHAQINFIGSSTTPLRRGNSENDTIPGRSLPNELTLGPSFATKGRDVLIDPTCTMVPDADDSQARTASTSVPLTADESSVVPSSETTQLAKEFLAESFSFNNIHDFFISGISECHGQVPVDMQNTLTRCSISSDGSNSSEDIVLFNGRNSLHPLGRSRSFQDQDSDTSESLLPPFAHPAKAAPTVRRSQPGTSDLGPTYSESAEYLDKNPGPRVVRRLSKRSRQATAAQADYIDNLRGHISDLDNSIVSLRTRNIDDRANGIWESPVEDFHGQSAYIASVQRDNSTTVDTDHMSTSSDPQHDFQQMSSTRAWQSHEQSSGAPEGEVTTEGSWFTPSWRYRHEHSRVSSELEADTIFSRRTKDLELNEWITTDRHGRYESIGDQHGPCETFSTDMTDEQMAISLTKQEELGFGSSRLLLFGRSENFLQCRDCDDSVLGVRATALGVPASGGRQQLPKHNDNTTKTVNGSVYHHVHDNLDVVDREPQSLSGSSKAHRATLPIILSDSDLENSMQRAWVGDRRKKKERKQAREALRAQGRLGKPGKLDQRSLSSEAMSLDQIKDNIKEFLLSDDAT